MSTYPEAESVPVPAQLAAIVDYLTQASPFNSMDPESVRRLAMQMDRLSVPAGTVIIRQGEPGAACFVILSGHVEVRAEQPDMPERRIATLGPGCMFGEAALLTDEPRNATVSAVEPCEVLRLRREDLVAAMSSDHDVACQILQLLHLRDRPRRAANVTVQVHVSDEAEETAVLKDPLRGVYYRLSPQGWFIWQRLDGRHCLRDLVLDYLAAFKSLEPQAIAETIAALAAAGFITCPTIRVGIGLSGVQVPGWKRAGSWLRRILQWRLTVTNVDAPVTRLFGAGVVVFYHWPAQLVLGLLAAAGLFFFFEGSERMALAIQSQIGEALVYMVPAYLLAIMVHEAGHAFTVKACGREVGRIGLGWYWLWPVAFVDTSDMWLAGRWQRVAVSLAGPYANVLLAGVASLAVWFVSGSTAAVALWHVALVSYAIALLSLNPLAAYDGYYVISDAFDRPNLRLSTFGRPSRERRRAGKDPDKGRRHWSEPIYVAIGLIYIGLLAVLSLAFYQFYLLAWLSTVLYPGTAAALSWVAVALPVVASVALVALDVRGRYGTAPGGG